MKKEIRRIYRSRADKKVAGICGGMAEYFNIDAVIVRLITILFLFCGIGFIWYILAWIIIPINPK